MFNQLSRYNNPKPNSNLHLIIIIIITQSKHENSSRILFVYIECSPFPISSPHTKFIWKKRKKNKIGPQFKPILKNIETLNGNCKLLLLFWCFFPLNFPHIFILLGKILKLCTAECSKFESLVINCGLGRKKENPASHEIQPPKMKKRKTKGVRMIM